MPPTNGRCFVAMCIVCPRNIMTVKCWRTFLKAVWQTFVVAVMVRLTILFLYSSINIRVDISRYEKIMFERRIYLHNKNKYCTSFVYQTLFGFDDERRKFNGRVKHYPNAFWLQLSFVPLLKREHGRIVDFWLSFE